MSSEWPPLDLLVGVTGQAFRRTFIALRRYVVLAAASRLMRLTLFDFLFYSIHHVSREHFQYLLVKCFCVVFVGIFPYFPELYTNFISRCCLYKQNIYTHFNRIIALSETLLENQSNLLKTGEWTNEQSKLQYTLMRKKFKYRVS